MVLKVSNDRLNAQLLVLNKEIPELRAQIEDEKHRVREVSSIGSSYSVALIELLRLVVRCHSERTRKDPSTEASRTANYRR